jgi:MFS family permease
VNTEETASGSANWAMKGTLLLSPVPLSFALGAAAPILPRMTADLAHTAFQAYLVKMVVGIVGAAIVVGGPLAGLLVDRIPRRSLFLAACLAFALAGCSPMVLDNLFLILASRVVMGVAAVAAFIVGATLVADQFQEPARSRWMGFFTASAMAFAVLAGIATGLLGDIGWRWAFLLYLLGVPIGALGAYATGASKAAKMHGETLSASRPTFLRSMRIGLVSLAFMCGVLIHVPSVYIPFRLHALGLLKPSSIALALTISIVASMLAAGLFGAARRGLSARSLFCCSFIAMTTGIALIAVTSTLLPALSGLFLIGAGMGWITPNLTTAAFESVDESHRGRMLGVMRAAESLAPTIGVSAAEAIVGSIGQQGVLLLNAALGVVLLIVVASGVMVRSPALAPRVPGDSS